MKTLQVGIASLDETRARTLAIAGGERKRRSGEPRVWFTSVGSFARILSEKNQALLALIVRERPASLSELAELSGRRKSNLSRTLKTLSQHGLVHLERRARGRIVPHVRFERVQLQLDLTGPT